AGYIEGSGGMLHPRDTITREEFAKVMDNMVEQYIDVAGTYTEVAAEGNVVIRVSGVTLDGVDINGDLVIGDGVGNGDATLKDISVSGRALIRGGGENSVIFTGSDTDVRNIVISRGSDGRVRILTEDGAVLAEAEVDGDSDVILEGTFGSVTVMSDDVTVTALNATITDVTMSGQSSNLILSGTTTVETVSISGTQSELIVQKGATVETVEISATNVTVSGEGTVDNVEVQAGGDGASITTPNTVTTVSSNVDGVTAGGEDVPAGGTATNNSTGTDATVTEPSTGGGGGGGTPAFDISIHEVAVSGTTVTPTGGVYIISAGATKDNTSIDVTISNVRTGTYSASLIIKNVNDQTVAHASATGLDSVYVAALGAYGGVTFADIANLSDRLGTSRTGTYLLANGTEVTGSDQAALEAAIENAFNRMSDGEVYTVTVAFTGAASDSLTFQVQKNII
ncbi:MAG TPA: hypothetical protein DF480_00075, partial [Clostridiales bacterium]|nr:hypothetical protein [Clostridiales bacterium]